MGLSWGCIWKMEKQMELLWRSEFRVEGLGFRVSVLR